MLVALAWFWIRRAVFEASGWLEKGLQLEGLTARHRAGLLYHLGHATWLRGDLEDAEAWLQQALELWAELGMENTRAF